MKVTVYTRVSTASQAEEGVSRRRTEAILIAAVERAVDPNQDLDFSDHADVVNMSLGGLALGTDDPLVDAVEEASSAGVVFAIAAGNQGEKGFFTIDSPGTAPSAITVGAVDDDDHIAFFSSKGPALTDGGLKPEVVAPGAGIHSSMPGGGTGDNSGTSMASPHVAGVAALIKALHPAWSPADIKSAIVNNALILGNDITEGSGRVDALAAAKTSLLASPSTLSFGHDSEAAGTFQATRITTVRNVSSETATWDVTFSGLRDGIRLVANPSSVTLAPGASQPITVSLSVVNELAMPQPGAAPAFGGQMVLAQGSNSIHLPWSVARAALLVVRSTEPTSSMIVHVIGSDGAEVILFRSPGQTLVAPVQFGKADISAELFLRRPSNPPGEPQFEDMLIVFENQTLEGRLELTASRSGAPYELGAAAVDERGQPLTVNRECARQFNFDYPRPPGVERKVDSLRGLDDTIFFTSKSSRRMKVYASQTCVSKETGDVYATQFQPLDGVSESVVLRNDPLRWRHLPLRVLRPRSARDYEMAQSGVFRSPRNTSGAVSSTVPSPSPVFNANVFLTPDFQPEFGVASRFALLRSEPSASSGPSGSAGPPRSSEAVVTPIIRFDQNGFIVDEFDAVSPVSYRPPAGEPLAVGEFPAHPVSNISSWPSGFLFFGRWQGPIGEERHSDFISDEATLFDASDRPVTLKFGFNPPLAPGAYRLIMHSYPEAFDGTVKRGTYVASFDTNREDASVPSLTALRILNVAGAVTSSVPRGSAPKLVFSAVDGVFVPDTFETTPGAIREEATKVEYRAPGGEWKRLTAVITAQDYGDAKKLGRAPVGTVYSVDLSQVTRELSGAVDLRVRIEDPAGNASEVTLEPGFVVTVEPVNRMRQRPSRK